VCAQRLLEQLKNGNRAGGEYTGGDSHPKKRRGGKRKLKKGWRSLKEYSKIMEGKLDGGKGSRKTRVRRKRGKKGVSPDEWGSRLSGASQRVPAKGGYENRGGKEYKKGTVFREVDCCFVNE